ncbi:MAG TPA: SpoIIE family protein phosphatase, partial [Candidatus Deferrimicrobium sp.]|nr:SpoIIE family protein phosphatase [Candidatus Deferrimicrobium sp.]
DEGPGIARIEAVLEDGFSTTGSLGIGLGAVKRLMTEFTINSKSQNEPLDGLGTRIVARKYLPFTRESEKVKNAFTRYSVFSKSKTDEKYNGDNYFLHHYEDKTMIAVIDGLGSGRMAFEASLGARRYLIENYRTPLEEIIHGIHQSLKLTRGVAISIALISDTEKTLEYVGIGNVLGRVYNSPNPINIVNYNGTLGIALQKFKVLSYPWQVGNIIILTTDGISSKYNFEKYPALLKEHPIVIVNTIFRDFSKMHDDATILVGGPA